MIEKNDLVLRALRREKTERTPVWLMRQAGRSDPAYRDLRRRADLPLEDLFRHPDLATEISLLPKRFGVDAIIFFQDILTPLASMGAPFVFRPGPVLDQPIRHAADIDRLRRIDPADQLPFVGETLAKLKDALDGQLPLLGFAGAPLTLAFFLLEGQSPGTSPPHTLAMMRDDPKTLHRLLDKLADMTADYLSFQIESGADAVQLFESTADLVSHEDYREFAHPYHVKIFSKLGQKAPTILFAKQQTDVELMVESGADCISLGSNLDLKEMKQRFGHRVALQGNICNRLLLEGPIERIDQAVRTCIKAGESEGHILNLNHGLLKDTPFEHVKRFIETARATRVEIPSETTVAGKT